MIFIWTLKKSSKYYFTYNTYFKEYIDFLFPIPRLNIRSSMAGYIAFLVYPVLSWYQYKHHFILNIFEILRYNKI